MTVVLKLFPVKDPQVDGRERRGERQHERCMCAEHIKKSRDRMPVITVLGRACVADLVTTLVTLLSTPRSLLKAISIRQVNKMMRIVKQNGKWNLNR